MSADEKTISAFMFRVAALLVLKHALSCITAWGFLWGTAVLVLRAAVGTPRYPILWGLVGIAPAAGLALLLTRQVRLDRVQQPSRRSNDRLTHLWPDRGQ